MGRLIFHIIDPALIDQNVETSIRRPNWPFPRLGFQDNEGRHYNSAYAEFEREIIQDRVKAGIKAKREKTGK